MTIQYVSKWKAKLRSLADPKDEACDNKATLLWGDPVHVPEDWVPGTKGPVHVTARTKSGWLDGEVLSSQGLLEIYVIDVGQGDSILMRTPDDCWHLIDGGASYRKQMTRKSAVDFLQWKFMKDLKAASVTLENVILSHPDDDHFGGLADVFKGETNDETFPITIKNYYHNGLARFAKSPAMGARVAGKVQAFPQGGHGIPLAGEFVTELLDGKDTFVENPARPFNGEGFREFAGLVNRVPLNVHRLSNRDGFLKGYESGGQNPTTIRVLGPVLEDLVGGQQGLRYLEKQDSLTCNGHSVTLLIEYGAARLLLAGDLNTDSQELLLSYHAANEFAVDVGKACHHGAEDVDLEFIQAMQARATVISSGDNEDFSHPRPLLMGAVARYGRCSKGIGKEILPPLIYSTELARSMRMAFPKTLEIEQADKTMAAANASKAKIKLDEDKAFFRPLKKVPCSSKLVYGLVNIRTDGKYILCATMEEKGNDFDYKVFRAGVDA